MTTRQNNTYQHIYTCADWQKNGSTSRKFPGMSTQLTHWPGPPTHYLFPILRQGGPALLNLNVTTGDASGGDGITVKKGTRSKAVKSKRAQSKNLAKACKDGFGERQVEDFTAPPPAARMLLKREDSLGARPATDNAQEFLGARPSPTHHAILENRAWVLRFMLENFREDFQNEFLSPLADETEALPLHLLAWSVQCHEILAELLLRLDHDVRYEGLTGRPPTSNLSPPIRMRIVARPF